MIGIFKSVGEKKILFSLSFITGILTLVFISLIFVNSTNKLLSLDFVFHFDYGYLAAFFLAMISSVSRIKILKKLDQDMDVPIITLFRIFFASWLARYVPTKIFSLVTRITLTNSLQVSRGAIVSSSVVDFIFQFLALSLLSLPIVIIYSERYVPPQFLYFVFALYIIAGTLTFFVFFKKLPSIARFLLKRYEKVNIGAMQYVSTLSNLGPYLFLRVFIIYFAAMFLWGSALFFLLKSFTEISYIDFFEIVSIASFASAVGFFIIFLPAGAVAREGILFFLLGAYVPFGAALGAPIIFRIGSIAIEVFLFVVIYTIESKLGKLRAASKK